MFDVILIRYGELFTKKKNFFLFIKQLEKNLKFKLKDFPFLKFKTDRNQIIIFLSEHQNNPRDCERIIFFVKNTFGIANFSLAKEVSLDLEAINKTVLELVSTKKVNTFKVDVNRRNKKFPLTSLQITIFLANSILKQKDFKVNLTNPELTIYVEIHSNNSYVTLEKMIGLRGYPVGVAGKALLLLSGGIDSPVSAYFLMKRGLEVEYLHFMTPPFTKEESLNKVISLVEKLTLYSNENSSKLHICNFTSLQQEINHIPLSNYKITIMRRMFIRIANKVAKKNKILVLATGECLGQVASQTIQSMSVINESSDLLILRPLITYDKTEIINVANQIDTYNTSIIPFEDCCSLFVPVNPIIKPNIISVRKQEQSILWQELLLLLVEQIITKEIIFVGNNYS